MSDQSLRELEKSLKENLGDAFFRMRYRRALERAERDKLSEEDLAALVRRCSEFGFRAQTYRGDVPLLFEKDRLVLLPEKWIPKSLADRGEA